MPEEKVQKNGDAIIAGDFTFELREIAFESFRKEFLKNNTNILRVI